MPQTMENTIAAADKEESTASVIRSRIEESELKDCLKSSMGGYTKKSVHEYFARIKKQYQANSDLFNIELRRILDEKDKLSKENGKLAEQLGKTDSEYRALYDSLSTTMVEDTELSLQDIMTLKSTINVFQEENASLKERIKLQETTINQLNSTIENKDAEIERGKQEMHAFQERLVVEKKESLAQRQLVAETAAKLEEQRVQVNYLNQIISEGKVAELRRSIDSLTGSLATQKEVGVQRSQQLDLKTEQVKTLTSQLAEVRETANRLSGTVDSLMLWNEKLTIVNSELTAKISEMMDKSVGLITEKAQLSAEKLLAERRLAEATHKTSAADGGKAK